MSHSSDQRSEEFLKISGQFKLGALVTESSHPATARLSETAREDVAAALGLLFQADEDVLHKYREFVGSGRAEAIQRAVAGALRRGGRLFFTGCGSTGRLSIQLVSIWRDFWRRQGGLFPDSGRRAADLEGRAFSVMAGGDYALIKSVEGFEDFTAFGKKQLGDLGVSAGDVVFAITEGGETSFVIGTAWKGLEAGAKVYFVYNNPDDVLCACVTRSREIIQEPRIEKLNLTTGPMAITGSTRMQATTIQLCVLLTILEMVARDLLADAVPAGTAAPPPAAVPAEFMEALTRTHGALTSPGFLNQLARAVSLEETVYRSTGRNNYFADRFGIDVLTDTTERSPTYCTPPFRKFDDATAAESWAFLFIPEQQTDRAWESILKRPPACVGWSEAEVLDLVGAEKAARTNEILRRISRAELMRFKIGMDGIEHRPLKPGDCAVVVLAGNEASQLVSPDGFYRRQLEEARRRGAARGLIAVGQGGELDEIARFVAAWDPECVLVALRIPRTGLLLDGVTRAGLKMLLNALSTCIMVRLGRVMGNYMIWVVPSNLKLIDRATRYIQKLVNLDYEAANRLLFEVIEHIEPRMKADQAYPPAVGLAVLRARHSLSNEAAEQRLARSANQPLAG